MKNVLTDTTHGQRKARRRQREDEKHRACAAHQRFHAAMAKAEQTNEPQLLGKDFERGDIYIEPPYEVESGFAVIVPISIIRSCRVCMGILMPDPLDQRSHIRDHLDMGMVEDIARVLRCH